MRQPRAGKITLSLAEAKNKISRHIYGHFAEHLGRGIYDGFYVGANSAIPNRNGLRLDVVDALKKIRIPNLRWPGGCFADTYHWRDGVGPKEERPTIVNTWWGGVTEDNSFGTHDFLDLCALLEAEPFVSANVGSGTVRELADWVQYVNFEGTSPMSALRTLNGREKPWGIRFWGLGNEPWGCGGNMSPEYYADLFRQYATFMTGWSNTAGLFRIAAGAQSADYRWTEVIMKNVPLSLMEGLGLHHYSVIDWNMKGPSTGFSLNHYFRSMNSALFMDALIRKHGSIMDKYDPEKKVALIVDEWGAWYDPEPGTNPGFLYQQNTMRDAMIAAVSLNIFNSNAERVRMANLAQAVNVLQCLIFTHAHQLVMTPTYHVFEMYARHHEALSVPLILEAPSTGEEADLTMPSLSASASLRAEDSSVFITICNIDPTHSCDVEIIAGADLKKLEARILVSDSIQSFNSIETPDRIVPVVFDALEKIDGRLTLKIPPASVVAVTSVIQP